MQTLWQSWPDAGALADAATDAILDAAPVAIEDHGSFRLVLAGGTTPQAVYQRLAARLRDARDWQLYFGDERCLPRDDPGRNSVMAHAAWLYNGVVPAANIHVIPAELGAAAAARHYADTIAAAMPFDLVLLGIGEDGHTASLFPGDEHDAEETVHAVYAAPKPPPERVSLSRQSLSDSDEVLILVSGAGKADALRRWRAGADLPVAGIRARTRLRVFYDAAAGG